MSKELSIFVEGHLFDHGYEGAATYILGLYGALLREFSDEFRIIVGSHRPERAEERFAGIPGVSHARYRHAGKFLRNLRDIPRICASHAPDAAHFQYFTPLAKSCPWVVTIHDNLFDDFPEYFPRNYRRVRDILFPLSARRADLLTTVSSYSADAMHRHYGTNLADIVIIPNAPPPVQPDISRDTVPRPPLLASLGIGGRYLICVSRHEPRKNQALLLEAFARLQQPDLDLLFVGSRTLHTPELEDSLAQKPADIRERVHFAQGVSDADLQALLLHAEASVYPSLAEGFGLPPLETLVLGTPTICSNRTAMADFTFFDDWHFDPVDADQLAQIIRSILADPDAARVKTAHMRDEMLQRYSWRQSARIYREHLHRGIARHN